MTPFPVQAACKARVLVIGDIMLDRYWFGEVDRISPEAPVPVVRVARKEDRLGGAANVARNVAALGAHVSLLGVVGADEAGDEVHRLVAHEGIISQIVIDTTAPTTLKMRVLGRQQQLLRIDFEEHPEHGSLDGVLDRARRLISEHDIVVLSDYAKGVLGSVEKLISMARDAGVPVLVDPKGRMYERYRGASMLTPNRTEMGDAVGHWTSEDELALRAQDLRVSLGLEALLITRSEEGMSLFTEDGSEHVDAFAHEVFDVSGAGDTVLATLAVTRASGLEWNQAMYWANRAGGVVVGKLGTSVVTPEELL